MKQSIDFYYWLTSKLSVFSANKRLMSSYNKANKAHNLDKMKQSIDFFFI